MDELRWRLQEVEHSWMECKEREISACKPLFSFVFLTWHYLSRDLAEWVANILAPREPRAVRRRLLKVRRRRVVIGVVVGVKELPLKRAFFEKSRTLSSIF